MTLYVKINEVEGIPSKDTPSHTFQVMLTETSSRKVISSDTVRAKTPDFSGKNYQFEPMDREKGDLNIQLVYYNETVPATVAGIKLPLTCFPKNKKIKKSVNLINYNLSESPVIQMAFHFDTKGAKPFDVKSGHIHTEIYAEAYKSQDNLRKSGTKSIKIPATKSKPSNGESDDEEGKSSSGKRSSKSNEEKPRFETRTRNIEIERTRREEPEPKARDDRDKARAVRSPSTSGKAYEVPDVPISDQFSDPSLDTRPVQLFTVNLLQNPYGMHLPSLPFKRFDAPETLAAQIKQEQLPPQPSGIAPQPSGSISQLPPAPSQPPTPMQPPVQPSQVQINSGPQQGNVYFQPLPAVPAQNYQTQRTEQMNFPARQNQPPPASQFNNLNRPNQDQNRILVKNVPGMENYQYNNGFTNPEYYQSSPVDNDFARRNLEFQRQFQQNKNLFPPPPPGTINSPTSPGGISTSSSTPTLPQLPNSPGYQSSVPTQLPPLPSSPGISPSIIASGGTQQYGPTGFPVSNASMMMSPPKNLPSQPGSPSMPGMPKGITPAQSSPNMPTLQNQNYPSLATLFATGNSALNPGQLPPQPTPSPGYIRPSNSSASIIPELSAEEKRKIEDAKRMQELRRQMDEEQARIEKERQLAKEKERQEQLKRQESSFQKAPSTPTSSMPPQPSMPSTPMPSTPNMAYTIQGGYGSYQQPGYNGQQQGYYGQPGPSYTTSPQMVSQFEQPQQQQYQQQQILLQYYRQLYSQYLLSQGYTNDYIQQYIASYPQQFDQYAQEYFRKNNGQM